MHPEQIALFPTMVPTNPSSLKLTISPQNMQGICFGSLKSSSNIFSLVSQINDMYLNINWFRLELHATACQEEITRTDTCTNEQ